MVLQLTVADVMTQPVLTVTADTSLQDAVQLIGDHHIGGLPVVNQDGGLIGELTEQDLMVRESGVDAGPYVMLLDSVIYPRNPLNWDKQVHQVLGTAVADLMQKDVHSCEGSLPLPRATSQLHVKHPTTFRFGQQPEADRCLTRGDVVRACLSSREMISWFFESQSQWA